MTTTMRQSEGEGNGETATILRIAELLRQEVDRRAELNADYAKRESAMHEVANGVVRCVQRQDLQQIADGFETVEVILDGKVYRQHEQGSPSYHGLSGSMSVQRWTYREVGSHNGPTIVPLDLAAGLAERATPALVSAVVEGCADTHSRELREHMLRTLREPPSRTTLERIVRGTGHQLRKHLPAIEPVLRAREKLPEGTVAMSLGLDRTTVPMEEELSTEEASKRRRKKRTKPYVRKPPARVEVNYRMAYVGTVSLLDIDARCIRTLRYFASAEQGPKPVVDSMMRDLKRAQRHSAELPLCVVQDAAPEMWNLVRSGLAKHKLASTAELIDRYHLNEHLMTALRAGGYTPAWCEQQLREWNHKLDEDDEAIDEIEAWIRKHRYKTTGKCCEALVDELTYLENNKDRMHYASHRAAGLPCGSGPTEGACKSLVKARACRSGQRWHPEGVDNVLTLRALAQSERLPRALKMLRRDYYVAEVRLAA